MRSASIYYDRALAGTLTETEEGLYTFVYHPEYIRLFPDQYLTFSMPATERFTAAGLG
ncbi:HipA-like protein [Dyadobacter sp. BE34]|uniref:HipA-like protein n=1 Tax=Dyadobacter fermentans TaxID=94254 RepID=A0ABU1QYC0_9BACT|nr:HipA-like protein [Dyadobacter fermentans]MDR7043834.1 HipA-like protein [Dyadobacter sp. BE242]MDR7198145.1 HipA-like protein [Dyadobacter sp. BE34]MDR7216108.1 HipA-like protein [Dyadobacter sp. BE31]MDR7264366.1 HipA-like protein [Dyadobacter sp. BE32]